MYHAYRKNNISLRTAIFKSYHERCVYCGRVIQQRDLHIDHILPTNIPAYDDEMASYLEELRVQGFIADSIENYLPCCPSCNIAKSNRMFTVSSLRFYHELARNHSVDILRSITSSNDGVLPSDCDGSSVPSRMPIPGVNLTAKQDYLQREPIYGNPNHTLADIFVHHSVKRTIGPETIYFESVIEAYIKSSQETTHRLFLLLGDYGVGKSSSLKMLASKYNDGSFIYISLKDVLLFSDNIRDGIIDYCRRKHKFSFDYSSLQNDLTLLLDGFDELQRRSDASDEERLFTQIKSLTQYDHVKVILSSRSTAFINSPHLLCFPTIYVNDYDDPQIDTWIEKWKQINRDKTIAISMKGLQERNLLDICRNKLILYMVARIYNDELLEARAYTKAYVYKCFFDWTIDGKFKEDMDYTTDSYHGSRTHSKEEYRRILQNIALVISQFSTNEIISVKQLDQELKNFQRQEINSEIFDFTQHLFTRHFFSTQSQGSEMFIEFSHKSLREYIYAEKIFTFLKEICAEKVQEDIIGDWYQFGRNQRLSKEVFEFLEELLCDLSEDDLITVCKKMYSWSIILLVGRGDFKRYVDRIVDKEKAILNISESFYRSLVLSAMAGIINHISYNLIRTKAPERYAELKLIGCDVIYKICDYYMGTSKHYFVMYTVFSQFVKYIHISEQNLANIQYMNMKLHQLDIIDSGLFRSIIQYTKIDHICFLCADISITKFDSVEFCAGTIEGCEFESCVFNDVVFRNVRFKDVSFDLLREGTVRFENCTFENTDVKHYLTRDTTNPLKLDNQSTL